MTQPISLRPDPTALANSQRRSFVRACTAQVLAGKNGRPDAVLARNWPDDAAASRILKAAKSPTTSADLLMMTMTVLLPTLAPQSASARLLGLSTQLDMTGVVTISLPYLGATGAPIVPFVAEGANMPITNLTVLSTQLGPSKKLLIGAALTGEVQAGSGDKAAQIIGSALATRAERDMDALLFSNAAATAIAPAGILNGVTAIPSAGKTGVEGVVDDMALLAEAFATAGINSSDMIIVTRPGLAEKIKQVPKFTNTVLSSASVATGNVIAVAAGGLVTGYDGAITVEVVDQSEVHMEDTAPTDISTPGAPPVVAYPVKSLFQTDSIAVKIRGWCAWVVHPGAVKLISGAAW